MTIARFRPFFAAASLCGGAAALVLVGCGKKPPTPEPAKDPAATTVRAPTLAAAGSISPTKTDAPSPRAVVPVLGFRAYEKPNLRFDLWPIDNTVLVADIERMGRVTADTDKITWIGLLPEGHNISRYVTEAAGSWPDKVDVAWAFDGRSPNASYLPLKGNGSEFSISPGGKMTDPGGMSTAGIDFGHVHGIVTIGASTLLSYHSYDTGSTFRVVRGPNVKRRSLSLEQAGCAKGEAEKLASGRLPVAVVPRVVGATPKGTLLALGGLCEKRADVVEVWDAGSDGRKSRIVKLPDEVGEPKNRHVGARFYGTKDDEALLFWPGKDAPLRYRDGTFEALVAPPVALTMAFVTASPDRVLHGSDGQTLYRLDDAGWTAIARFAGWPGMVTAIAGDGKAMWAVRDGRLGKIAVDPSAQNVTWRDDCATPFVFLYDVAAKNEAAYTFPTTQKALAGFPEAADLGLVEATTEGQRRLGVVVKSKAQGDALMAYLATAMKDEKPSLLCFGGVGRRIPLDRK